MGKCKLRRCIAIVLFASIFLSGCKGATPEAENERIDSNIEIVDEAVDEKVNEEALIENIIACEYVGEEKLDCFLEPILQKPTDNSVVVQWFTLEEGTDNKVNLYEKLPAKCVRERAGRKLTLDMVKGEEDSFLNGSDKALLEEIAEPTRVVAATTTKLSRIRGGNTEETKYDPSISCDIYKHVAVVDKLPVNDGDISNRIAYTVSTDDKESFLYTLAASPIKGTDIKILLTSDHQTKPMTAANIEKVYDTIGDVDAVWMNGDIVDVIDSAYDWFYADNAFWRVMTGTANSDVNGTIYKGAQLLQEAPMFTAMGNHDVMGVYDDVTPLDAQFNNPKPYDFNDITYKEMLELPESSLGSEKYYAVSMGDVRLVSLDVNRVWRLPNVGLNGKYSEIPGMGEETYGYGDFIFEPIDENSDQIKFLKDELASDEYQNAKYKAVMFHHDAHSLGGNQVPAFTDPVASKAISPITGQEMVVYDYPIDKDYIVNDVMPLLAQNENQLVFEAHSHVWCRFLTLSGMNILEASNVGNNYGGFASGDDGDGRKGSVPSAFYEEDAYYAIKSSWDENNYVLKGDPNGLDPEYPSMAELPDKKPYLASNSITAFTILDTKTGSVDSYYFDTNNPDSEVVQFDSFKMIN